jgi:hypothetical protein
LSGERRRRIESAARMNKFAARASERARGMVGGGGREVTATGAGKAEWTWIGIGAGGVE